MFGYRLKQCCVVLLLFCLSACGNIRSLPDGLSFQGPQRHAGNVSFLSDITYLDTSGKRHTEQQIMDRWLKTISKARRFILVDMFLYNDVQGPVPEHTRALADDLTRALIRQKKSYPAMRVVVITDPINVLYGGVESPHFVRLRDAGIEVYLTDLTKLRDSNPVWSAFWRVFIRPFGNSKGGHFTTKLNHPPISARSFFSFLNLKANHRKVLIVDTGKNLLAILSSGNAHDASSAHSNVALALDGPAAADLLHTENAVLIFSGAQPFSIPNVRAHHKSGVYLNVLTESKVRDSLIAEIGTLEAGDELDLAMFLVSHRRVMGALVKASERGVAIRVLLDPNEASMGIKLSGLPNKPTAAELKEHGVDVRWCLPHGGQCHSKILISRRASGRTWMSLGSTNLTRRSVNDFNLETNIVLYGPSKARVFVDANNWFQMQWANEKQRVFSTEYEKHAGSSLAYRISYLIFEVSGWGAF
ncbi:MAG: phospholipase [Hyphomicrobiales bacterium]|nr:MAG: phospholipase [Hyphomicrobiales bacterium]